MDQEKQPVLLSQPENNKQLYGGPVFEAGPGWGDRIKNWLKKFFTNAVLPPIAILILLIGLFLILKPTETAVKQHERSGNVITETVEKGDGYAHIARRALAGYLAQISTENLTNGQKVFVEEKLRKGLTGQPLVIGAGIKFVIEEIEDAIAEARELKPSTLEKWEEFSKKVKFE